jgi:hypothetical protein
MPISIKHRFNGSTLFDAPTATTIREGVIAARKAGAYLRGAYLRGAYLGGAYLRGADLGSADLGGADLRGAYLRGAYLGGADLRGADLGSADLGGAYLGGADLRGAYLRGNKDNPAAKLEAFKGSASRSDGYQFLIFTSEDLGNIIRAGCRTFTLEEFRAHVAENYPGSPKAEETIRILNYLEGCLTQQAW